MTTDAIERLRAANPVPVLGRVGDAPVFADVSRKRAPSRRVWVIVVAAIIAALVGAPGLAIGLGVIDFESSEPAPPRVVKDFASLSEAAPPGMDPEVIAGEARQLKVDGHTLWVAPTRSGGLCYGWDGGGGGCDKLGTVPLSVSWLGRPTRAPGPSQPPRSFYAVQGFAHARWVDAVEVRLDDGTAARPQVAWISAPIDAGFFRYVAAAGRDVVAVVGFRGGEEVIGDAIATRLQPHPYARLEERTKLAEVGTAAGPVHLWTAPTTTDGRCVWLEFRGEERAVAPCLPRGYERQAVLALALHEFGGTAILAGQCGYAAVELTREDGVSRTVRCREGIVFARLEPGELDGALQALDKTGQPLRGSRVELARLRR
jgi:hypothetical protein